MSPTKNQKTQNSQVDFEKSIEPLALELARINSKLDTVQDKFDVLRDKLEVAEDKIERVGEQSKNTLVAPPKASWLGTLGQILTVLSVVVLMFLQLRQASLTGPQNEKTIAETQKINTEELKTRAELQKLLDDLAVEKSKGIDAYEQQLELVLPTIQEALDKLNELDNSRSKFVFTENLYIGLLILIFMQAVNFFLDALTQLWSFVMVNINIYFTYFIQRLQRKRREVRSLKDEQGNLRRKNVISKRAVDHDGIQNIIRVYTFGFSVLANLPWIAKFVISIFIFTTLTVPLFDSVSASLGSDIRFSLVLEHLWKFDLAGAVNTIRIALFQSH